MANMRTREKQNFQAQALRQRHIRTELVRLLVRLLTIDQNQLVLLRPQLLIYIELSVWVGHKLAFEPVHRIPVAAQIISWGRTEARREVEPSSLVRSGARWYLLGWDLMREDWRHLLMVPLYRLINDPLRAYLLYTSVTLAIKGGTMGWNKLDRTGSMDDVHDAKRPATALAGTAVSA